MSSPYVIVLSDAEEAVLSARARSGRGAYRDRLRAQIVLAAAAGTNNTAIAVEVGCARTPSASGAAGSPSAGWAA